MRDIYRRIKQCNKAVSIIDDLRSQLAELRNEKGIFQSSTQVRTYNGAVLCYCENVEKAKHLANQINMILMSAQARTIELAEKELFEKFLEDEPVADDAA